MQQAQGHTFLGCFRVGRHLPSPAKKPEDVGVGGQASGSDVQARKGMQLLLPLSGQLLQW